MRMGETPMPRKESGALGFVLRHELELVLLANEQARDVDDLVGMALEVRVDVDHRREDALVKALDLSRRQQLARVDRRQHRIRFIYGLLETFQQFIARVARAV